MEAGMTYDVAAEDSDERELPQDPIISMFTWIHDPNQDNFIKVDPKLKAIDVIAMMLEVG